MNYGAYAAEARCRKQDRIADMGAASREGSHADLYL